MKKRVFILFLAVLLIFSGGPIVVANSSAGSPFSDVSTKAWFYPYVTDLYEEGVIHGTGHGTFEPYTVVTWGQAFKLILGAIGVKVNNTTTGANWAIDYVKPAIDNRLVYSFNTAYLNTPVDRKSVAQMTARALDLVAISGESPYADCDDAYVVELFEKGIMEGDVVRGVRYFSPNNAITRAEMATIIWRIMRSTYTEGMLRVSNYWVDIFDDVPLSPFTRGQFATNSRGRMTYNGGYYASGIDVSEHKGIINWAAVAADGIDFAIIRVGGRYLNSGGIFEDKYARRNIEGALAAGLDVGVYFFSQAINAQEGLEEAEFVLDIIRDYDLTFPVVCDWEYLGNYSSTNHARTYLVEPNDITAGIAAFCERVEREGYTAGVYFNEYCGMIKMDLSKLAQYQFWYAQYSSFPRCVYDFQMWQYSSSGKVSGIGSATDMNICFVPYPLEKEEPPEEDPSETEQPEPELPDPVPSESQPIQPVASESEPPEPEPFPAEPPASEPSASGSAPTESVVSGPVQSGSSASDTHEADPEPVPGPIS